MAKVTWSLVVGMAALFVAILGTAIWLWRSGNGGSVMVEQAGPPPADLAEARPGPALRSRRDFATTTWQVKEGVPELEVLALLGEPDDVRTQNDPGGISTTRSREVWRYGTNGHLTFPTLGCVSIGTDGRAQYVSGGGEPRSPETLPEEELRRLLRLIDAVPSYNSGSRCDPLAIIRAVNALLPLGKEKALAVIEEYLRVCSYAEFTQGEGAFLVLRVLFEVPEDPGYMPPMYVGASSPGAPKDPKRLPHFPLLLIDDVPLLLVGGYMLAGQAEHPTSHVAYFREHGRLRARPLTPPAAPLGLFDRAWKSVSWLYADEGGIWHDQRAKLLLMNQLLRLVDSVHRRDADLYGDKFSPKGDPDPGWREIVAMVGKLDVRWDGDKDYYTYKDGTRLPDPPRKVHRREIWKLDGLGGNASVIIERRDEHHVSVGFTWEGRVGDKVEPAAVRVYSVKKKDRPLAEFDHTAVSATAGDAAYVSQGQVVRLDEGELIQAQVEIKGVTKVSPVYQP